MDGGELDEVTVAVVADQPGEHAAPPDGAELGPVADEGGAVAMLFAGVEEPGEVAGADHAGFVDDDEAEPVDLCRLVGEAGEVAGDGVDGDGVVLVGWSGAGDGGELGGGYSGGGEDEHAFTVGDDIGDGAGHEGGLGGAGGADHDRQAAGTGQQAGGVGLGGIETVGPHGGRRRRRRRVGGHGDRGHGGFVGDDSFAGVPAGGRRPCGARSVGALR